MRATAFSSSLHSHPHLRVVVSPLVVVSRALHAFGIVIASTKDGWTLSAESLRAIYRGSTTYQFAFAHRSSTLHPNVHD